MRKPRGTDRQGRPHRARRLFALLPLVALAVPLCLNAQDSAILQYGFEAKGPVWQPGASDAKHKVTAHKLTDETAAEGQKSEFLEFQTESGSYIHYTFPVGRAPVNEEFVAKLRLKANRPGVQLMARLVLPHERDPKNLDQPLTTLIRGEVYESSGRWQPVKFKNPQKLVAQQQTLLRAELKRDVSVADAYVDQLVLNVYAGPGLTRVWVDDLEIGPLLEPKKVTPLAPTLATPKAGGGQDDPPGATARAGDVKLDGDRLVVSGKKFFLRGIRHSGTPVKTLKAAGFNTLWVTEMADEATVEQAVNLGFWLVPMLSAEDRPLAKGETPGQLTSSGGTGSLVGRRMARFLQQDAVLCWDVGGNLGAEQYTSVARTTGALRSVDPTRPVAADLYDGFQRYSRGIDQVMLGVHRWPLMTGLELSQYREWLAQRRQLAQPGTYSWTWVQTHLPEWFSQLVYEKPTALGYKEPVGPQPEQIRLLAYTAVGAGCKGLGFWSDRFLADSHAGRDRLLQMALLNMELQLLEPMLVTAKTPSWVRTSAPEVQAAVMRTDHGVLCIPVWIGKGSQMVPGQAASRNLSVVVPQVPNGTQAWLVSPAEVRTLKTERVVGGTKVTIPEFGLTAAVVFTSDLSSQDSLVVKLQDQTRRTAGMAAQWAHDLAVEELDKVTKVNEKLEESGHKLPDGAALLEDARRRVQLAAAHRRESDFRRAFAESERALRPLRILMRAQWELAVKELDTPVASPYAVSFYSLPRHWAFRDEIAKSKVAANVLPEGDFEQPPTQTSTQWRLQEETPLDEVTMRARRVSDAPMQGKQSLALEITPKDPRNAPAALERAFLAVHSPVVKVAPGSLVRISGWVRIPKAITASTDGALLYDSIGGEPLAVRLTEPTGNWKQFTLYRRVPATGSVSVTLALMGLGKVYFDDVKIEPLGDKPARGESVGAR